MDDFVAALRSVRSSAALDPPPVKERGMVSEHDIRAAAKRLAPHDLEGLGELGRALARRGVPAVQRLERCYGVVVSGEVLAVWEVEDVLGMGLELLTPFALITDTLPERQSRLLLRRRYLSVEDERGCCRDVIQPALGGPIV